MSKLILNNWTKFHNFKKFSISYQWGNTSIIAEQNSNLKTGQNSETSEHSKLSCKLFDALSSTSLSRFCKCYLSVLSLLSVSPISVGPKSSVQPLIALWLDSLLTVFDCYAMAGPCNSPMYSTSPERASSPPPPPNKPFLFRRSAPYKIPTSPPILGGDIKFILQPCACPRRPSTDTALRGHHNIRQHFPNQNSPSFSWDLSDWLHSMVVCTA